MSRVPAVLLLLSLLAAAAGAQPARGRFLVASPELADPNFTQTVVLLIEHGPEGSWGLVINRPTQVPLARMFPEEKAFAGREALLYSGGPVSPGQLLLLVLAERPPVGARFVFGEVHLALSPVVLRGPDAGLITDFRAYAGYSGWAPGQLEMEIARGDWGLLEADALAVFAAEVEGVWPLLQARTRAPVASVP